MAAVRCSRITPSGAVVFVRMRVIAAAVALALGAAACATSRPTRSPATSSSPAGSVTGGAASAAPGAGAPNSLPGAGRPRVMLGDKNFAEQFVLGELYMQALQARGFSVELNRNIGPTEVTIQALQSGRIDIYPEYLGTWNTKVAGYHRVFQTLSGAYRAAQRYAVGRGLRLLDPTPFSNTGAIAVTPVYAKAGGVRTIADLGRVAHALTLGGPLQFAQLPALERSYNFVPAAFKALEGGAQYQALDAGAVQAAEVNTTDGQLIVPDYQLLSDPRHVFGWGNVVPVVPAKVLAAEGPAFAATINEVDSLLSTSVMRALNASVDLAHQDPALVARQFLLAHGVLPIQSGSSGSSGSSGGGARTG